MLYRGGQNIRPRRVHIRHGSEFALCGAKRQPLLLTAEAGDTTKATCKRCLNISLALNNRKSWLHV